MEIIPIKNPFGAPVYHEEIVSSTMDAARAYAAANMAHGTVITADFQEAGRGRLKRLWNNENGKNLLFTMLLRYKNFSDIPPAITLRTGLAVSFALEDFAPALCGLVKVKWPNDVMIGKNGNTVMRKAAGILTETDGKNVFIGVGVNVAQKEFPAEYRSKAVSLIHVLPDLDADARFPLLEKILERLYFEIEQPQDNLNSSSWRQALSQRLYKKGEVVTFADGAAGSDRLITGILRGIGPGGELLIIPKGEEKEKSFTTGELRVY